MAGTGKSPEVSAVNSGKVQSGAAAAISDMQQDFGGANPIAKVTTTNNGTEWILNGKIDGVEGEVFLYIDNAGNYRPVLGADAIRNVYIKNAVASGQLESLRERLYKAGYMNEQQFKTKDSTALNGAVVRSARNSSVEYVSNFLDTGVESSTSYNSWLGMRVSAGAGSNINAGASVSSRTQTDQDIDEFFMDYLGRKASPEEKLDYYNQVNKEEKKAVKKSTTSGGKQTTTGEYLEETDYYRIRANVLKPAVKGTAIEEITKGNGKIAQDVAELRAYAADYGIQLDAQQALNKVTGGLVPGGSLTTGKLDAEKKSIIEMSKAFYGKLSPLIDQGVKISDISNQFAYYKGKMLELPDTAVSVFDEDIQAALKNEGKEGVMTISEYQKMLRTNPKTKSQWLKTQGAKEEAAGFANSILKSFGLMA
jgi:hypothetical protein